MHDIRHAFRSLARAPGFTATALATLAICLGANLTIFAVVDAILVRALPFPEPDRLVIAFNGYPKAGYPRTQTSIANYFDRRGTLKSFSSVSIERDDTIFVGEPDSSVRVPIAQVSPEFFATLGVPLAMGRTFAEDELNIGADAVAVITDGFWRSHFAADPNVLGRTFLNDGKSVAVIGVLPRGFRFLSSRAEFYRPASYEAWMRAPGARHIETYDMIARLAPDATVADAQSEIDTFNLQQAPSDSHPEALISLGFHTVVVPLHADHVRTIRPALVLLQCGAAILLLIGAVNLTNLLLIRASARAKEQAVRQALGATKRHIVREVFTETTLLALGGGVLGLLLSAYGLQLVSWLGADRLPLGASISMDAHVAVVSLLVAIIIGVFLAAPIVWFSLRARIAAGLHTESRGGTTSRGAQRLRHAFIVAQVALAFVLLSGAGLLGASLERVLRIPTGFASENLLTGKLTLPVKNYPDRAARLAFIERLLPALQSLPGVTHVAVNNSLPFTNADSDRGIGVEGFTHDSGDNLRMHHFSAVSSDYWETMTIPRKRGRLLEDADNHREQRVCVVDEAVANYYWPGENPLGHRLAYGDKVTDEKAITVVGEVAGVKQDELTESAAFGAIYVPCVQFDFDGFSVVVRSPLPTASVAPMIRQAIKQLDPTLLLEDVKPMQVRIDDTLVARRSPAILAGIFAAVALSLAAIGTYGVLAYAVCQRRREIGVRMALGAQAAQVGRQFLFLGVRLLAAGMLIGLAGAWLAGQEMQSVLFDVPAFHRATLATTAAVLSTISLLACWIPARRATRVDPMIALRSE